MSTRCLIPCLALAALVAVIPLSAAPPNILFILCDDLGFGDVGVFFQQQRQAANVRSEPWHFTPHLDRFAAEGAQLPRHYASAPVCAPSRASLLLGVHQGHANVRDNQFDKALADNHTLATVLKQAGYATAVIGKWGLQGGGGRPARWPAYPTRRGFDFFHGYVRHVDGHTQYPFHTTVSRPPKEVYENDREISGQLEFCYSTDLFTARAKRWIQDHHAAKPGQPFFLYLAYSTPHAATQIPTVAYPAGGGTNGGLQWLGTPGRMINTAVGPIDAYYHPDYATATWDHDRDPATPEVAWPDVYKRYATMVRRIDDGVGDLLTLLRHLHLDTNTLVVFTSDNGPSKESYLPEEYAPDFFNSFGPHDGIKRDLWEGGVRVGALVRWPGTVLINRVHPTPSTFADWMPTFAQAAGVPSPAVSDGVSLLPLLTGKGTQRPPLVYMEYFEGGRTPDYAEFAPERRGRSRQQMQALYLDGYKGIRYDVTSATDRFEIYDTLTDPQETNNLALQPAFAALQQRMQDRVLQVRRPEASAPRPYDTAPMPASPRTGFTNGVVGYATFTGDWPWMPEFAGLTASTTGRVAGLDLAVRPRATHYGVAFTGYLSVPTEGDYTFYGASDAGMHFRIHDATVLDDDFKRTGAEVSGTVRLAAGRHPVRLYYRHRTGAEVLQLEYSGPGFDRHPVPREAFSLGVGPGPEMELTR